MHQEIFHKRIAYTSDSSYCYAPKNVSLKNYIPQKNFFSSKGAHSITFWENWEKVKTQANYIISCGKGYISVLHNKCVTF